MEPTVNIMPLENTPHLYLSTSYHNNNMASREYVRWKWQQRHLIYGS